MGAKDVGEGERDTGDGQREERALEEGKDVFVAEEKVEEFAMEELVPDAEEVDVVEEKWGCLTNLGWPWGEEEDELERFRCILFSLRVGGFDIGDLGFNLDKIECLRGLDDLLLLLS